jgi:hypothetical protein
MSVFASVGILILAMLIMVLLQLSPGIFLLFSHYASGKYSRRKASDLSLFFIFGAETCIALVFLSIYFILTALYLYPIDFQNDFLIWIIAGIFIAIGLIFPFCYFRKGRGTKLFVTRHLATAFNKKASSAKSRSDAFILGFISTIPELLFTLPIYTLTALEIMELGSNPPLRGLLILVFILVSIAPLLVTHVFMDFGHNLVEIEKFRVRNKNFTRFFISLIYFLIAILIITFRIVSL